VRRGERAYILAQCKKVQASGANGGSGDVVLGTGSVALQGVGDARFTQKCLRRLREFREAGATILFVSHDPAAALAIAHDSLTVPDAGQRQLAARLTARPGNADSIGRLGPLLGDRNPSLRRFVAGTLADLGADASLRQPVIEQGVSALGGDQWRALEQGALLLGHLDHEPAAERLMALLDHDLDRPGGASGSRSCADLLLQVLRLLLQLTGSEPQPQPRPHPQLVGVRQHCAARH
jgi:hypothetical protein